MKRSVIWFSAAFSLFTYLEIQFSLWRKISQLWGILLIATVAVFVICQFTHAMFVRTLLCGALCGLLLSAGYTAVFTQPIERLSGTHANIRATVCDYAKIYETEQRVTLKIKPTELGLSRFRPKIKMLAYIPKTQQSLCPGDQIQCEMSFYVGDISDGFESKKYYESNNVFILGSYSKQNDEKPLLFSVERTERIPLWAYPLRAARNLKQRMTTALPDREAGLVTAILIGDKDGLAVADTLALRKAGLSHVTAVSGMHVGFLVSFFFLLFGREIGSILSIFAILFFIPMAGASPSVIRAGVMYLIAIFGFCVAREKDGLNSLCIALMLLLIHNPYAICSLSLQLSFAATLGLLLFSERIQTFLMRPFAECSRLVRRIPRFFLGSIACSAGAMIFTTPILFASFGYVSIFAPIANLLAVSVVGLLFICGHLCGILLLICPTANLFCGSILKPIADYLLWVADTVTGLPHGLVYWGNQYGFIAVSAIYLAIALLLLPRIKIKLRFVLPMLCVILITVTTLGVKDSKRTLTIACLPSGAGQTIIVSNAAGACTLIDCGASGFRDASANVQEYMILHDLTRIDTIILTAMDKTHARHVPRLLRAVPVGEIIYPRSIRETPLAQAVQITASNLHIPCKVWEGKGEQLLASSPANSISLIGDIDRKLAVRVRTLDTDILILHSFTQKMLSELLTIRSLCAKTVVLSEANMEDAQALQAALAQLSPTEIILQSGYSKMDSVQQQYPVCNTYVEGEIVRHARIAVQ